MTWIYLDGYSFLYCTLFILQSRKIRKKLIFKSKTWANLVYFQACYIGIQMWHFLYTPNPGFSKKNNHTLGGSFIGGIINAIVPWLTTCKWQIKLNNNFTVCVIVFEIAFKCWRWIYEMPLKKFALSGWHDLQWIRTERGKGFFIIHLPPELLSVLGPLERWCDAYTWRGPAM